MIDVTRERRLLETFAALADTLVDDYDVVDLLQMLVDTCAELLDTTAAAILLADQFGDLDVVASTSEASRLVEVIQLGVEEGPCIESFRTGRVVEVPDIAASTEGWVRFKESALEQGFGAIFAVPLRLRETTIGTLNLLRDAPGELEEEDLIAAQAFADVATIGILHERALRETAVLAEQLQGALNSRIVIEQAKGVVAHTNGVPIDEAFVLIRSYARSHQIGISEVAARIVNRSLQIER
jgi:transcriptional regulator with GAF, ATPase, and Fis domain